MPRFSDVDIFLGVIEAGSFRKAADRLHTTKSTVSRAVARLEKHLGVDLITRDTRSMRLTDAGADYHRQARQAALVLAEGERLVAGRADRVEGTLRVSATPAIGIACLARLCADFLTNFPHVDVELSLSDRVVNPLLENFDLAIRVAVRLADSDLKTRRLLDTRLVYAATPSIADELKRTRHAPGVRFTRAQEHFQGLAPFKIKTRFQTDSFTALLQAVRAGAGIGLVDEVFAREDFAAGRLVRVAETSGTPTFTYWAVYPAVGQLPPKTRAFLDFLVERFDMLAGAETAL